jgi:predicted dehydrogenase
MLRIEIYGTVGHAYASKQAPSKIVAAIQQLLSTSKFWVPYVKEVEHFVECIQHDLSPTPSGEDGLKDLEAISSAYRNGLILR